MFLGYRLYFLDLSDNVRQDGIESLSKYGVLEECPDYLVVDQVAKPGKQAQILENIPVFVFKLCCFVTLLLVRLRTSLKLQLSVQDSKLPRMERAD